MVLVVILVTSLATFLIVIITSIVYLISLIVDESDDSNVDSLGINTHDFSLTPVESPNEPNNNNGNNINYLNHDNNSIINEHNHVHPEGINECCPENDDNEQQIDANKSDISATSASTEELKAAIMNSKIIDAGKLQQIGSQTDSIGQQQQQQQQQLLLSSSSSSTAPAPDDSLQSHRSDETIGLSSWQASAGAQKNLIVSQLGAAASRPLFDDFDTKEMQLGGTGLHWCKTRKSLDKLIKLGLPIEIVNKRQETALHVAVKRHKLQVLVGLLNKGANIESRNENGETPLILACKVNDIFACQLLLIFDADFNARDKLGHTARHYTASICDKHKTQQQLPSAAHLILAMLNEIGAERCPDLQHLQQFHHHHRQQQQQIPPATSTGGVTTGKGSPTTRRCTDGCSATGNYNGNSYNRWPSFQNESLYKRHMFADIIEEMKHKLKSEREENNSIGQLGPMRKSRLLCIDGGGLRGVIVCQIMIELEKYLSKPMVSYFDWIGGTSVGGFLACALCNGTDLFTLRSICFDVKDEVFSGSKPYNSKFIERVLKRTYGKTLKMSDLKDKKLAVTTVIADRDPCQLRLFRNYKSPTSLLEMHGYSSDLFDNMSSHSTITSRHRSVSTRKSLIESTINHRASKVLSSASKQISSAPSIKTDEPTASKSVIASSTSESSTDKEDSINDYILDENDPDPLVWQAVRASAAAPFFFKPYGPYLDGGIISNNPTLDMLGEFYSYQKVREFLRHRLTASGKPLSDLECNMDSDQLTSRLDLVVSLGTGRGKVIGRQAMFDFSQIASGFATVFSPRELLRSIRAARDLFKKVMQHSCHTDDYILDRAQAWCSSLEIPYFRINPPLATVFSIDDKRDEQLINALWQTKLYMKSMKNQLIELRDLLDGPSDDN